MKHITKYVNAYTIDLWCFAAWGFIVAAYGTWNWFLRP